MAIAIQTYKVRNSRQKRTI